MSKNFKLLYLSQILSQVTFNIINFLLLAKIYEATGSSIATSLLWVSYSLPTIFFGPIGAGVADLLNRRKILIITNFLQALTIFLYIFTYQYSVFLLFAVVMVYSLLNQFYVPAEMASLPTVVGKTKLVKANSLFFLTQQIALVIGFGFAGIMQKLIGFEGSLIVCSIALFVAFLSVYFLPNLNPVKKIPKKWENIMSSFFKHIVEGYLFIKNKKFILYPLALLFIIQVGLAIIVSNVPVIATEILRVSVSYVGLYVVVPVGIGAAIGSVLINKLIKKGWRKKRIIDMSLGFVSFGILAVVLNFPISPFFVLLIGLGFVGINIPAVTYLQEVTPDWLRGRVFGNLLFVISLTTVFPVIFSGVISEFFGVKTLLTIMSIGVMVMLMYSLRNGQKLIERMTKGENF